MKRIILFFTVCLGLSVHQTTFADDAETVRAATKRANATNVSINNTNNRVINSGAKRADTTTQTKNIRTATTQSSQQRIATRTPSTAKNVKTRTPSKQTKSNVVSRVSVTPKKVTSNRNVNSRKSDITATARSGVIGDTRKSLSRAATLNDEKIAAIKSADYSKCKTVYYECMDEFCANKDTNLRRCACSSRIHEFDNIKKQLSNVEDKMLDFNQSLLIVNLDKEDAAAINVATEGELAFSKKDTSESEKLLQKITNTLNGSGDSKINNNLSAISLSLDMDTAWDNVDSLSGVATTSKNGLDLYNAARPVCIAMAKEVCSDNELGIVQDGYKLTIQQDCDTVAKSYKTMYNSAMEKIHESGALLDMSRLNIYQQRNSDDALVCKKKILEQLSNPSVCGEKLYKCLDITGQYINPSNGEAFLSENLADLSTLIQEPVSEEKWSEINQNLSFVNMLKSKKKFLEPAIEQCQDIADTIWKEFLDDALSQIKLAQNAKLEEIRQSCTTLVAECKTEALTSLSDFDARALSIFSVGADKTANEMCSGVTKACSNLMANANISDWESGIIGVSADITYDTVIDTCSQIGRDCIVQKCNGTSGNFALCQNLLSDNRSAILNRTACWNDVFECVKGADNLLNMNNLPIIANRQKYYNTLYKKGSDSDVSAFLFCNNPEYTTSEKNTCLITEQIWGNCETNTDKILIPNNEESTLLSWLAINTGTADKDSSCNTSGCPDGYVMTNGACTSLVTDSTTVICGAPTPTVPWNKVINVSNEIRNYCDGVRDKHGNCCKSGNSHNGICVPDSTYNALLLVSGTCDSAQNGNQDYNYYCPTGEDRRISVYCITTESSIQYTLNDEPNNEATYTCSNGTWVLVDQYGNYFGIKDASGALQPKMTYIPLDDDNFCQSECTYGYTNNAWSWTASTDTTCTLNKAVPTDNEFTISYETN